MAYQTPSNNILDAVARRTHDVGMQRREHGRGRPRVSALESRCMVYAGEAPQVERAHVAEIERIVSDGGVLGERYPRAMQGQLGR